MLGGAVNLTIIAAAISATVAFGSAWTIQSWRFDAKEKERGIQINIDQQAAFKSFERTQSKVIDAQRNATHRATVLRVAADAARVELVRLRDATAAAMQTNADSLDACLVGAATAHRLLNTSAERYQALGARADRHVNDIRTLTEAWPK